MANYERSPSRMMFASELRDCNLSFQDGEGQFATTHIVSPTGEDIHRVFMVGAVTEREDIGTDNTYWRVRIVDPSGSILGYAGTYQPEAMQAVGDIDVPSYVALSGKLRLFTTEDGTIITSISIDNIKQIDKETKDLFVYFAARNLLTRLLEPDENKKSVQMAKEAYQINKNEYFKIAKNALESIKN